MSALCIWIHSSDMILLFSLQKSAGGHAMLVHSSSASQLVRWFRLMRMSVSALGLFQQAVTVMDEFTTELEFEAGLRVAVNLRLD